MLDQLFIISIILAVLATIFLLSRVLKGLLRIVAIALVSFTLIVVGTNISNSSSSWFSLSNWLRSRNAALTVENTVEVTDAPGGVTDAPEEVAETPGNGTDPPPDVLPAENGEVVPDPIAATLASEPPQSPNPDFAGTTAVVSSPQDPNIDQALSEFASASSSDPNLIQVEDSAANPTGVPATPAAPANTSSRPINALW